MQDVGADAESEELHELFTHPGWCGIGNQRSLFGNPVENLGIKREIETGTEFQRAQHANRIFGKAGLGITNHTQLPVFQVFEAANVVNDREVGDVVEEGIDGEVSAEGIFAGSAELILHEEAVFCRVFR